MSASGESPNKSLLPEDDTIFHDLSGRPDNLSSDCLVEDSFAEEPIYHSTPSSKQAKQPPSATRHSPRLRARALTPTPAPLLQSPKSPARPASLSRPAERTETGKRRTEPSSKQSGRLRCPKCPNTFANKKTLDTHLRTHVLKGVTSKAPTLQDLLQVMERLVKDCLKDILKERVIGDLSASVHSYCEDILKKLDVEIAEEFFTLLSENYFNIIKEKKILFPSAIRNSFYCGTNALLSSPEFTRAVQANLFSLKECSSEVLNIFVGNFMLKLCDMILVFSIKHMRCVSAQIVEKATVYKVRSHDSFDSQEFKQLVYHIGGSVVNGFLWKGKVYSKNSQTWTVFCSTLKERFLSDEAKSNQCSEEVRSFSQKKDRGGYKHINNEAFSFFLLMFQTIMSHEAEDGSMPPNILNDVILSNDVILCLWVDLVGVSFNQESSLDLLVQLAHSCVKVVQKGIMKRRLNHHLLKPYDSVPLRAKLAS